MLFCAWSLYFRNLTNRCKLRKEFVSVRDPLERERLQVANKAEADKAAVSAAESRTAQNAGGGGGGGGGGKHSLMAMDEAQRRNIMINSLAASKTGNRALLQSVPKGKQLGDLSTKMTASTGTGLLQVDRTKIRPNSKRWCDTILTDKKMVTTTATPTTTAIATDVAAKVICLQFFIVYCSITNEAVFTIAHMLLIIMTFSVFLLITYCHSLVYPLELQLLLVFVWTIRLFLLDNTPFYTAFVLCATLDLNFFPFCNYFMFIT